MYTHGNCPSCNHVFTEDPSLAKPATGAPSVCMNCGAWLQYDKSGARIPLSPGEYRLLSGVEKRRLTQLRNFVKEQLTLPFVSI